MGRQNKRLPRAAKTMHHQWVLDSAFTALGSIDLTNIAEFGFTFAASKIFPKDNYIDRAHVRVMCAYFLLCPQKT